MESGDRLPGDRLPGDRLPGDRLPGDRLLGFADLRPTRDLDRDRSSVGEIASFYVRPDEWNRGVGRALMGACRTALTEAGYEEATLWVLATNARAIRFYEAAGWRADGTDKRDVMGGVPIRDLRYRHVLP